jgi:hypothetical protein
MVKRYSGQMPIWSNDHLFKCHSCPFSLSTCRIFPVHMSYFLCTHVSVQMQKCKCKSRVTLDAHKHLACQFPISRLSNPLYASEWQLRYYDDGSVCKRVQTSYDMANTWGYNTSWLSLPPNLEIKERKILQDSLILARFLKDFFFGGGQLRLLTGK